MDLKFVINDPCMMTAVFLIFFPDFQLTGALQENTNDEEIHDLEAAVAEKYRDRKAKETKELRSALKEVGVVMYE